MVRFCSRQGLVENLSIDFESTSELKQRKSASRTVESMARVEQAPQLARLDIKFVILLHRIPADDRFRLNETGVNLLIPLLDLSGFAAPALHVQRPFSSPALNIEQPFTSGIRAFQLRVGGVDFVDNTVVPFDDVETTFALTVHFGHMPSHRRWCGGLHEVSQSSLDIFEAFSLVRSPLRHDPILDESARCCLRQLLG